MMDARQKKTVTVLCLGTAFLVWRGSVLIGGRLSPEKTQASPVGEPPEASGAAGNRPDDAVQAKLARALSEQAAVADKPWGRDPFDPLSGTPEPPEPDDADKNPTHDQPPPAPVLKLTGVSRSDERWLAVVRGDIVRVGDVIDGQYTVSEITKRSITLVSGKWAFRYEMGAEKPEVHPCMEAP